MKRFIIVLLIFCSLIFGQTYPTGQNYPPPTDLITVPTAATLMRGSFSLGMRIQDGGGMILGLRAGITDRFQFGLSYGSPNLIGDDSLRWYPRPEANLKYMLIDESITSPGVAFGLNTQGFGNFNQGDSLNRYDMKAYGLYFSASKNWKTGLGNLGLHGGVSYNFTETDDGDEDPNLFFHLQTIQLFNRGDTLPTPTLTDHFIRPSKNNPRGCCPGKNKLSLKNYLDIFPTGKTPIPVLNSEGYLDRKVLEKIPNPRWIEWLMGFPDNWTFLEDTSTSD